MVGMKRLSWICSTLTECRFRYFVPVNSICSLSGINAVRKSARTPDKALPCGVLVCYIQNKKDNNKCHCPFYGGLKAAQLELFKLLIKDFIEELKQPYFIEIVHKVDFINSLK